MMWFAVIYLALESVVCLLLSAWIVHDVRQSHIDGDAVDPVAYYMLAALISFAVSFACMSYYLWVTHLAGGWI